jgi:hypothetical protein
MGLGREAGALSAGRKRHGIRRYSMISNQFQWFSIKKTAQWY